ncbi:MAG TPA: peptidase domain-containing ABC transporter [Kofleriaceae bacterium]|nr:peptidase domain-containing ABC transporter [Kofleriaceae bacterium]
MTTSPNGNGTGNGNRTDTGNGNRNRNERDQGMAGRFPAVRRIGLGGPPKIPFVQQMEWTDCGAACLAMVLGYHGRNIPLARVRDELGLARDGVSARNILEAGARLGLIGRGVKVDVAKLPLLARGSILHWEFNHFVVFDRLNKRSVRIFDPAVGVRDVPFAQFAESFTGVALELSPAPDFRAQKANSNISRLRRYARELLSERLTFDRIVIISLVLRILALVLPLLTSVIVDQVVPRSDYNLLLVAGLAVVLMVLFNAISEVMRAYLLMHLRTVLDVRSTLGFLDHLVKLPFRFFQQRSDGDLMMRLGSNGTVREMVTSKSLAALLDGTFVLLYGGIVFGVSAKLGAIVLVLVTLEISVFVFARGKYMRLMAENLEKQAKSQSFLVQFLSGIETLKCSGVEQQAVEHWSNLYADELNVRLRRGVVDARVDALRQAIATLAPVLLLTIGAMSVMKGEMTLGTMLAMNSLATSLFGPLSQLVESALDLQLAQPHIDRVDDVLHTSTEQDPDQIRTAHEIRGDISTRDLSFRYAQNMPLVVDGVTLDIPAGSSVAIVGPSGSGKTTLLNLIAGLYQPTSGSVFYDGRRLADLDVRGVRRQIGFVPQHPYVFGASLRENIALTQPDADLDRIMAAARVACLHEDILAMPMSYDTPVADGGASLSGGQRQRIALARAILRQPAVMFIDEGTSALDNATESRVIANIERLRCTRITIAHRLTTIQNADVILVMVAGKLVEVGSHDELMRRRGHYHELVAATDRRARQWEDAA